MSVINKMLRDLDQRNSGPTAERKHTVSVAAPVHSARPRRKSAALRVATAALSLFALAGIGWFGWQQTQVASQPVLPAPPIPAAAVVARPDAAAASLPAAVVQTPASAPDPEPKPVVATVAVAPPPAPVVSAAPANTPLKLETTLKLPRATTKESPAEAATAAPAPVAAGQRLLQAGREAQVQAQALWISGAKEAAIDLLQQAVGTLEAGLASEPAPGQSQLLVTLVRDLTRMQLADGRAGAAWDLLVRLEPLVRNDADLWAVRGNAAQRLGRHQDSTHAYMAALQSRPNEQRWLLGAAVSLAASGQAAAAAGMAERAQAAGPISPDVQAYLRQMGVPFKDK